MRTILINALLILFIVFNSSLSLGQNKFLDLGVKNNGISIGNSAIYNGLRLNLWDKNVSKINGVNLAGMSRDSILNGIAIGILSHQSAISN